MRSDDEAARALRSPPSTNQGAHNDQSTVQQNRSLRAELSASSPLRLPEGSLQKAAQAAAALAARLLETKHVPEHVPMPAGTDLFDLCEQAWLPHIGR